MRLVLPLPVDTAAIMLLYVSVFFRERQKGNNVFASVRAGDVNGYDGLPLSTTVVCGEGREPRRSLLRSR